MSPGPYSVDTRVTPLPRGWYPSPALRVISGYHPQGRGGGVNLVFTSYGPGNVLIWIIDNPSKQVQSSMCVQ